MLSPDPPIQNNNAQLIDARRISPRSPIEPSAGEMSKCWATVRENIMKLGFVGLGAMGGALARRLMLSHKLRVLDLRPEAIASFVENGAIPTQDGASMARECDVVMLCLPRSSDVRAAIFGEGGLIVGLTPGQIVVDQTTGNPNETRAMAAELAEKGVIMIDAPVSGGPAGADAGTITIMVGGEKETFRILFIVVKLGMVML